MHDFEVDPNNSLLVERIPMSHTELTFIISKINMPADLKKQFENIGLNFLPHMKFEKCEKKIHKKPHMEHAGQGFGKRSRASVFTFAALDDVIGAANRIGEDGCGYNILYKHDGKYYLFVNNPAEPAGDCNPADRVLADYGNRVQQMPLLRSLVIERGEFITEYALQKFAKYF
jgi:negative regulator of genetic competence, sporulation and motility